MRGNWLFDAEWTWRAKARHDMDHHRGPPGYPFERPDVVSLSYSENGIGPVGIGVGPAWGW